MGQSGFQLIESGSKPLGIAINLITDYSLIDDWSPKLMTFLQIHLSLTEATIVSIIRDSQAYPINNEETVVGVRSLMLTENICLKWIPRQFWFSPLLG